MKSLLLSGAFLVLGAIALATAPPRAEPGAIREAASLASGGSQRGPQAPTAAQLVGAWHLTTRTVRRSDGTIAGDRCSASGRSAASSTTQAAS